MAWFFCNGCWRIAGGFHGEAGDGVSFLGEFACVSEHKKDAPLPAVL